MKILFATPYRLDPAMGGPAHTVVTTAQEVASRGADARLLTAERRKFPPPGPRVSIVDALRADVVHSFGLWAPFSHAVVSAARLSGTPYVVATLGMLEPWALKQSAVTKRIAMRLYQRRDMECASAIHATSTGEVESIQSLGVQRPIALIPHGMHLPPDSDVQAEEGPMRTALFLSRIHPKKGLLDLVQAWSQLRPEGWRVIVAGPDEGGHRAEVEAAVRRHQLEHSFSFVGAVEPKEKHRLMRTADFFVLPTYSENFGLVVPEALGHGTPVLTTRGTPWSELIETNSGWWIPTGPEAIRDALEKILSLGRDELRAMGHNGRQLVKERYSWSAVAEKHLALYRWMVGAGPKPQFVFG